MAPSDNCDREKYKPLASLNLIKPTSHLDKSTRFIESLQKGNYHDGNYQMGTKRTTWAGETTMTAGYDPEPTFSLGHGSRSTKFKYRETPTKSDYFVEHKHNTPLGSAYFEGGARYSNGVIGWFVNLTFR